MDNFALKCSFSDKIKKPLIVCTACKERYMVSERIHKCNPLAPCELSNKKTYYEQYWKDLDIVPDLSSDYRVLEIECDKCEVHRKSLGVAKKATCPECEYTGWYIHDESRLCPVCVAAKTQTVENETKVAVKSVEQPTPVAKKFVFLYVKTWSTGYAPNSGSCIMVEIIGSAADTTNPLSWEEFDHTWYLKENNRNSEYICKYWNDNVHLYNHVKYHAVEPVEAVQSIVKYIKSVATEYDYSWNMNGNDSNWKWLRYLFAKYASEDDQKLLQL